MVSTKTIVIVGIITAICVTALVVGIVLGTRSSGCSGDATQPVNVTVGYTDAGVLVEWAVPEDDVDCEVSYKFVYHYDLGGEHYNDSTVVDNLEQLRYVISPVAPCVKITFHIIPINEDDEESEDHYEGEFTVPLEAVPAPTNIQFSDEDEDNLEITWSRPDVGECSISYRLTITTDSGEPIEVTKTEESHTLAQTVFCLNVGVSIVTVYNADDDEDIVSAPATTNYQAPGVENIVEEKVQETLDVSWDAHPKALLCEIQYKVTYTLDGQDANPIELTTDELTLTFQTFYYCTPSQLTVTAFTDDSYSATTIKDVEAVDPETLSPVTDLSISDDLVISWTTLDAYTKCSLTYVLHFDGDVNPSQKNTIENGFEVTVDVPFCFFFTVLVEARFSASVTSTSNSVRHDEEPVIEGLTITEDEANPNQWLAIWDPHPREDMCFFQYQVEFIVEETVDYSTKSNTATRTFDKAYCAEGEVVVTISNELRTSKQSISYPLPREDTEEMAGISDIEFTGDTDLLIRWRSPTYRCGETYNFVIETDRDFTDELKDTDQLTYLVARSNYYFSVNAEATPILNGAEGDGFFKEYTVPLEAVPAPTNIQFSDEDEDNLEITWSKPDMEGLSFSYRLTITIDSDELPEVSKTQESHTLPQTDFCLSVSVSIVAVYNIDDDEIISAPETATYHGPGVENIVAEKKQETLDVTWDAHPKASLCEIQYRVTYTVDGQDENMIESTADELTVTFLTFYYCTPSQVTVTAFIDDSYSATTSKDVEAVDPETLSPVTDLSISDDLVVSWTTPDVYRKCSLTYVLHFDGDANPSQKNTIENEFQVTVEVPFCFFFTVAVEARFSASVTSISGTTRHDEEPVIEGLTITEDEANPNQWLAIWDPHPRQDMCSFQYQVEFIVEETVDYSTKSNTATRTFDKAYCAEGKVVVIISNEVTSQQSISYTLPREDTDEIAGISDIEFTGDTDLLVRWRSSTYRCGETYKVVIETDTGVSDGSNDLDEFTYPVPDSDYCFEVNVVVTPIRNGVEGAAFPKDYITDGVQNVEEEIVDKKLVISWDPHPKADTCSLSYRVTYTEANPVDLPHSENSITFDTFYYCFGSEVTVTAVNTNGETPGTTITIAPKNPTTIDPVDQLEAKDGIISWKLLEPYEKCSLTYVLDFTSDSGGGQEYTSETTFAISDSPYCFFFVVQVMARFSELVYSTDNPTARHDEDFTIEDLDIEADGTTLHVSWTPHAKSDQCSITYTAKYSYDDVTNDNPITAVGTDSVEFDMFYCTAGTVTVDAVALAAAVPPTASDKGNHAIIMPTTIGLVRNIETEVEQDEVIIKWLAPEGLERCTFRYDVTTLNEEDTGYQDSCEVSETSCTVEETCPMTINIIATIESISLSGSQATQEYDCTPSNDIPSL